MKIKLKDLKPNPFKKEIHGGKLNKEIIEKIQANIKELGLMGSLPIIKKDKKYYLIAGHHRVKALKETFGKDFEVECTIHNYDEEKVLRGMVVENLTQRMDELVEVTENLNAIRKWLASSAAELARDKFHKGERYKIGVKEVYDWLNKNGEVMSIGKISEYLKVHDNLDKRLLKNAKNSLDGKEQGKFGIEEAKFLAKLEKKEQLPMKKILDKTGLDYKNKAKLVTEYKGAQENIRKKVLKEEIDIKQIGFHTHKDKFWTDEFPKKELNIEKHIDLRTTLGNLFGEKLFLKKSSSTELEATYHYIINWIKSDLAPFLKAIEKELKQKGEEEKVVYYEFNERRPIK